MNIRYNRHAARIEVLVALSFACSFSKPHNCGGAVALTTR